MKSFKKKAVMMQLAGIVTGLVVVGIVLVVSFLIMSQVKANTIVSADANATAAMTAVQNAAMSVPSWLPIVVIVVIGALLIGLVSMFRS